MFLFSKVKLGLGVLVFSVFMAGLSAGSALYDGAWHLWFVPVQLFAGMMAFYGMSTRISMQVAQTARVMNAKEQAGLIVKMFDNGVILDPDFAPIAEQSRMLLEELEKAQANG